jgi:hypothetical protein
VDADCGAGGFCSPVFENCSNVPLGYFCHTSRDSCLDDSDCAGRTGSIFDPVCTFDTVDRIWECEKLPCPN